MQIRYPEQLTEKEYREQQAWHNIQLACCPFHPKGGCGFARHGTYPRKFPEYCLVARWYCPEKRCTISMLPDFFASRFPGTLDEVEHVVNVAEQSTSQEQAAESLRPDITLPSGLRWLRRRLKYVREILNILTGLLCTECPADLTSFRQKYGVQRVLSSLRSLCSEHLQSLPPIVGFGPRHSHRYSPCVSSNNWWGLAMPL